MRNLLGGYLSKAFVSSGILCALVLGPAIVWAQLDDGDVEQLFRTGLDEYESGQFREAAATFDRIIRNFPLNGRTTAAHVMKGKAQFSAGQGLEAARALRAFLQAYPLSLYTADAEYLLGLTQLRAQRYEMAMRSFLESWQRLDSSAIGTRLWTDVMSALDGVVDSAFSSAQVRTLVDESRSTRRRSYFWMKLAEKQIAEARIVSATTSLDSLSRYPTLLPFADRINALKARVEQRGMAKIGVLVPLMRREEASAVKELGTDILEGIQFAVDEHNTDPSTRTKVTLDVRDTERDPLVVTRLTSDLTADNEIVAIIGPVFSATVSAAVGLANARGVPLITPTANSIGIAAVGPYIFQANPDYEIRGRAMARFAVQKKGYERLAVLAPIDTYAKYMAEAFVGEALRLGAKIVSEEWYQRGTTDFTPQLRNIRKAGMLDEARPMLSFAGRPGREEISRLVRLGIPPRTIDSLMSRSSVIPAEDLLGKNAKRLIDSLGIRTVQTEINVDSLELPVLGIDGLYAPINAPEEIGVVASQIVYFNIKTALLGSGEWYNVSELDANKRYCTNVSFETDNHVSSDQPGYGSFVDSFFERHKKRPTKNTLYGYDAAKMILSLIHSGASTRETLAKALAAIESFQGFHSKIGFSAGRVNRWLQILHFDGEQIKVVDEVNIQ